MALMYVSHYNDSMDWLQLDGELEALRSVTAAKPSPGAESKRRPTLGAAGRTPTCRAKGDITLPARRDHARLGASPRHRWQDRRPIAAEEPAALVAVAAKIRKATPELKAIVPARGVHGS